MAGNIFSFVTGILPKKKNDGFYLQLDETGNVVEPAKEVAANKPAESTNGVKPDSSTNGAKAVETSTEKPAAKSKKTSIKAAKAESVNGKAPSSEVAAPAAPAPAVPQVPAETNFATKYLLSTSTNGRRRPGANMSSYLDMARQVKTPNK